MQTCLYVVFIRIFFDLYKKVPLTVKFKDKSTGSPSSWYWNFGDKCTSTAQNPTHKYNKAGKYTVSLTVENADGSDTKKIRNYIKVR